MRRLPDAPVPDVTIELDGEPVLAREGEPIAVALLAANETTFSRSAKYHRPRGLFCMAGGCGNCLMRVDGVPNVPTCRTKVRAGMRLERQNAFPSTQVDLYAAADFLFPKGLNHHEMFAGLPFAQELMQRVVRHLLGLGKLPDHPAPEAPEPRVAKTPVLVIGGGAAGLGAALELVELNVPFVLVERNEFLGGRLATGCADPAAPAIPPMRRLPQGSIRLESTALGLYRDEGGQFAVVVARTGQLTKIYADRFLITMGGHPQLVAFEDNDLPGIYAGRAVSELIRRHQLLPGERFALVGDPKEIELLSMLLNSVGAQIVSREGTPVRAYGGKRVERLDIQVASGAVKEIACDAVAVCAPVAPSCELAMEGGAEVVFDPEAGVFTVDADADGKTSSPYLFAAGEVTGPMSALGAFEHGELAAGAVMASLGGGAA